jgi:hypothetical protein
MKAFSQPVRILTIASVAVLSAAASAQESAAPARQYDFMLGDWDLEAATMQPDQTLMPGTGVMSVYTIHDGQTLQADMRVAFENGSGFVGSTMRTYDAANSQWAVSWVPAGAQTNAGAIAVWQDDAMVETWPQREDGFGVYQDTLILSDITENRFVVSMDRQYVDGPMISGVWRYVATRRDGSEAE